MALANKLGIADSAELARVEERISKKKAAWLFESGRLDELEAGSFAALSEIHRVLFDEIYDFAGMLRTVNISKGNFRFAPVMYLEASIRHIEEMPQQTFDEIVEKYVEMNIMHPFYEGNGRATRIWLDLLLIKKLGKCVDWQKINKEDYLSAMKRSIINSLEIKTLLKENLISNITNRDVFMSNINQSYRYENMSSYDIHNLDNKIELNEKKSKK